MIKNVHRSSCITPVRLSDFYSKIRIFSFHENPSSGSRVVPCGQTNMTKLIVAFHNFANAPKNCSHNQFR